MSDCCELGLFILPLLLFLLFLLICQTCTIGVKPLRGPTFRSLMQRVERLRLL